MKRGELLQLAGQHSTATTSAIAMARRVTCAADLQALSVSLGLQVKKLETRAERLGLTAGLSLLAAFGTAVVLVDSNSLSVVMTVLLGALPLFIAAMMACCFVCESLAVARAQLGMLKPLGDALSCNPALEYINAGVPAVLAWRDLAVGERGVLCEFDVLVMGDIHHAATKINADKAALSKLYGDAAPLPITESTGR